MDIIEYAEKRHAVKSFNPDKKIKPEIMKKAEKLLNISPSSINLQPWHYIIAETSEGKSKVAESATGDYSYNKPKMIDASHLVVFCAKNTLEDSYLEKLLDQEESDGRFRDIKARESQHGVKYGFSDRHRIHLKDSAEWMKKQVYISAGFLLLGASALDIDACPMEGFDRNILDSVLGLTEKGFSSQLIIALGYRSGKDFNAELPKSRLSAKEIFTRI